MPHLIVEYSTNLAGNFNRPALAKHLADAAVATGVFALAGVRVRFHPVDEFRVADGHPDNAFLHLMLRMGHGRDLETRKRSGQAIFDALCSFFAEVEKRRPLALSMEMVEIDPDLNFKHGNLRDYMKARGVKAAV
jgi:5-carboxymethyl-2-hydroxymuconate isomerase